jgi:CrcB protein
MIMNKVLLVFIGGGIGSATRYGTTLLAGKWFGTGFPWGTLAVNLTGCFLIGIILGLAEKSNLVQPSTRLFFVTGFLGGLTTFSSYAMESVVAFRSSTFLALGNIAVNNLIGLALVAIGFSLVERII